MKMIFISSQKDQCSMYQRSCSTRFCIFSDEPVSPRQPLTWAQPVMPGFTAWRCMKRLVIRLCSRLRGRGCGRGPTTERRPCRTLKNCGSSSRRCVAGTGRTGVTRESPSCAWTKVADDSSESYMVRNFQTSTGFPFKP